MTFSPGRAKNFPAKGISSPEEAASRPAENRGPAKKTALMIPRAVRVPRCRLASRRLSMEAEQESLDEAARGLAVGAEVHGDFVVDDDRERSTEDRLRMSPGAVPPPEDVREAPLDDDAGGLEDAELLELPGGTGPDRG